MDDSAVVARADTARRLHSQGLTAMESGRPVKAERSLRRALALVDGGEVGSRPDGLESATLGARILITLANAEFELYGFDVAMRRLELAARAVASAGVRSLQVSLHNQRGLFQLRVGRPTQALAEFDEATRWFADAPVTEQCRVLLNRGTVHLEQGSLKAARADLARCSDLARGAALDVLAFKAMHNLSYVEFLAGDLPRALRLMDEAGRQDQGGVWGIALLDRARVLAESGLVRAADENLAEAAAIFRRDRLAQDLAEAELERARCALVAGDVAASRRLAARARDRFRARGNDRFRRSAEAVLLQGDLAAGRPGRRLVGPALRLKAEWDAEGLPLQARSAALIAAEAYLASGTPAAAGELVAATPPPRRRDPITWRMHYSYLRASLAAAEGDGVAASRMVRAGLRELGDYQASFGSIDLQTASAIHGRQLADLGLTLALRDGRPAEVFAAAERARAVSSRLPVVRPPADPEAAELLAELRRTVEALRAVAQDAAASAPLQRRRRELERAVTARHWTLTGAGAARPIARCAEVRAAAADGGTTVVTYLEAAGDMHAVVLGEGRPRLHRLGSAALIGEQVRRARADLDVLAHPRLPGPLAGAVRSSFDRSAGSLDAALLAPLRLDGRRLVVVSTGILGQLPWGTLPSLRGVPVVVAPSATAWLAAGERRRSRRRGVVALAGPDLERAGDEVAGVARAWGGAAVHVGADAARPALTRAMGRAGVVHVAAHGTHQTENPLFSCLTLADGPLFAHELDQTARTPEHVVLSACELGLATVRPGDEALGLTSVLLHLGTRSVVAGVARVGDQLAAETMIAYHERLAAGEDSATALADAAAEVDSPLPFVCFGSSWQPGFGAG